MAKDAIHLGYNTMPHILCCDVLMVKKISQLFAYPVIAMADQVNPEDIGYVTIYNSGFLSSTHVAIPVASLLCV